LCLYMFVCIFFLGTEVSSEATTIEPGWAEQCNLDACMSRFFIACVYFFFKIIECVFIYIIFYAAALTPSTFSSLKYSNESADRSPFTNGKQILDELNKW
jgi:hypothetical protein